ncbi:hypothetical protein [Roseateles sp.]|uniref:hypothetical protein n=1 Tax=Roseateles sp. TaxID=1971397 RepID=UPI0039ECE01E
MSATIATRLATRLFPHRWWLLAVSLLALLTWMCTGGVAVIAALAGPVIFVPWALLCTCIWLHPEHGALQPGSRFVGRLPDVVQRLVRWYASLFLALFIFVGLILWPVLFLVWP